MLLSASEVVLVFVLMVLLPIRLFLLLPPTALLSRDPLKLALALAGTFSGFTPLELKSTIVAERVVHLLESMSKIVLSMSLLFRNSLPRDDLKGLEPK